MANAVTLVFAADTKSFDRGVKDVQAGADKTVSSLKRAEAEMTGLADSTSKAGHNSTTAAKGFREAATGLLIMSNELPPAVSKTALLAVSVGDLAGAYVRLAPNVKNAASSLTLFRGAGIAAGAAIAALGLTLESKSAGSANIFEKSIKDVNYALATNVNFVGQVIPGLSKLTGWWQNSADAASQAAHGYMDAAAALAQFEKQAAAAAAANGLGQGSFSDTDGLGIGMSILDPSNGLNAAWMNGLQEAQDQIDALNRKSARKISTGASAGISAAQKAAEAALQKWQSTVDKARQVGQSIADALAPKLEAGDQNLLLFKGPSLLEKLNKQLQDTKHLAKDISQLTKLGLSGDLIGQLVAGGLDSLPAADELLAGGKGSVAQANKLSKAINKSANGLATNEAVRQAKLSGDITLKVDPAANGDVTTFLVKLLQKYTRTHTGGNVQLALGK